MPFWFWIQGGRNSPSTAALGPVLPASLLGLLLLGSSTPTRAQEASPASDLLGPEQGLAIVNAAWEHRQGLRYKPDCSHLVHQVYHFAGFPYAYATSFDLYVGIPNFVQVEIPQAGDLIVWPGHVGIVVHPSDRSFYSSQGRGLITDSYHAPHWRGRAPARFYRYVLRSADSPAVATPRPAPTISQSSVQIVRVPLIKGRKAPPAPPKASSESARVAESIVTGGSAFEIPASILIVTPESRPKKDDLSEAISELTNAAGNALRTDDFSKLSSPVIIFDQLRVERVEVKRDRGWAHVQLNSLASIAAGRIILKRHREKRRWELRRMQAGWLAFTPLERVYVPRDVAVRVLAAELARLTQTGVAVRDPDRLAHQQAQLARLLYGLLEKR